jgi:hypothetical protein
MRLAILSLLLLLQVSRLLRALIAAWAAAAVEGLADGKTLKDAFRGGNLAAGRLEDEDEEEDDVFGT